MFRALCAHHQEVKIVYTASGIITLCRWPSGDQFERRLVNKILCIKLANYWDVGAILNVLM
jgi:hypothetical protein